jgi:hypothetical protein
MRRSFVTWRLSFSSKPSPQDLQAVRRLLEPIARVRLADDADRIWRESGTSDHLFVEPENELTAGELALSCLTKGHRLGRGWSVLWPGTNGTRGGDFPSDDWRRAANPEHLDGTRGGLGPHTGVSQISIAGLVAASFTVTVDEPANDEHAGGDITKAVAVHGLGSTGVPSFLGGAARPTAANTAETQETRIPQSLKATPVPDAPRSGSAPSNRPTGVPLPPTRATPTSTPTRATPTSTPARATPTSMPARLTPSSARPIVAPMALLDEEVEHALHDVLERHGSTVWFWEYQLARKHLENLGFLAEEEDDQRWLFRDPSGLAVQIRLDGPLLCAIAFVLREEPDPHLLDELEFHATQAEYETMFHAAVPSAAKVLGQPTFVGASGEPDFPQDQWAEFAAVWETESCRIMIQKKHDDRELPLQLCVVFAPHA